MTFWQGVCVGIAASVAAGALAVLAALWFIIRETSA